MRESRVIIVRTMLQPVEKVKACTSAASSYFAVPLSQARSSQVQSPVGRLCGH
jgi:hypothetical protein